MRKQPTVSVEVANAVKLFRDQRLYKTGNSNLYDFFKTEFGMGRGEVDSALESATYPSERIVGIETTLCLLDGPCVYFILGAGMVKIGHSTNPLKRLREIQAASPVELELLGVIPGDDKIESIVHQTCIRYKRRGEWFVASLSLLSFIHHTLKFGLNYSHPVIGSEIYSEFAGTLSSTQERS